MNSFGMSLLASQDETSENLLAVGRIDAAGEVAEVAAQVAEELVSRRTR